MPAVYQIDQTRGNFRVYIPALLRKTVFDGVSEVEIEQSEDAKGKFMRVRPARSE